MKEGLEKLAEIRNQKGEAVWSIWLNSGQAKEFRDKINEQENSEGQRPGKETGQGSNDEPMTNAQKRYLFRLLADKGMEGEAAYRHLKESFGVDALKRVTKFEASRTIDRLLNG